MANRSFSTQDKSNLAWFVKLYLKPHVGALSVVFVVILSQAFVYQQFLSLTERGLRVIFEQGQLSELIWICGATTAIFAVRAFGSYFIPVQSAKIAGRAVRALRTDLIQHLLGVRQEFFDRSTAGDVSLRLANQARDLGDFVGQSTVSAVRDALTIIVVSGYLIYKSPQLFAFAIVVIPMISVAINFASQRIKTLQRSYEDAYGHYMGSLDEMTSGMRTIKMTRQEASETQRLNQEVWDLFKFTVNLQKASAILPPLIDVASAAFYLLVIGVGGYFALSDQYALDGAGIISFLLGLVMLFDPAKNLGNFFVRLQSNLILIDSIRSYLKLPAEDQNPSGQHLDPDHGVSIALHAVDFSYPNGMQVLSSVDMQFQAGKTTAIVGATGSGKTTVLALLAKLYDRSGGDILYNGIGIDDYALAGLRENINIVSQDIVIFNKSIYENIAYARPDASVDDIHAAARKAQIFDLMTTRGDQPVGPKGSGLSGGQRQRIAIARAFLKSAQILILDEATSALDPVTEKLINDAFFNHEARATKIIVTHKLKSIENADMIYVLDAGQVVEQGQHADLMGQQGLYAAMYSTQMGDRA